jgi:hypothetical protein
MPPGRASGAGRLSMVSRNMKYKSLDFNDLLKGANLLVAGLLVYTFSRMHGNEYVDAETIVLAILLCIETHLALLVERRRSNPFIILLAFSMIFYYLFRILTLTLYPFSVVFDRYPYDASDSNYALIFIVVANVFLYAGFYIGRSNGNYASNSGQWKAGSPWRVVFLILAVIMFAYFGSNYWNAESVARVFNFLTIFLSQNIIQLMALSYFFLFRKSLKKKVAVTIAVLIVIEMVARTLTGSRSAVVYAIQNYILVALAIGSRVQFRRIYFILGIVLFPVVVAVLVVTFAISTYNRVYRDPMASLDVSRAVELAAESSSALSVESTLEKVAPLMAARAGFFDFSAEIIAHREEYISVINLSSYAKSIVDNILTPGFDVFDQPKISNALQFVYEGLGSPSKERAAESYQSDQLGMYGEFYALFGYASLPLFFLVAYLLKRVYGGLRSGNPFVLTMKRVVVLFVFVKMLDSFGLDWIILDTLSLVVAIYIYRYFFFSKPISVVEPSLRADFHLPQYKPHVVPPN